MPISTPLPPYSYFPGGPWPHPSSSPQGHSFGHVASKVARPGENRGASSPEFLRGVDLFNFGYYWEAHEVWEGLWHACGLTGPTADFFRGLIKLAAAGVKVRQGVRAGVASHAAQAAGIFRDFAHADYFGLHIADLLACSLAVEAMAPAVVGDREDGVKIVFPFVLSPQAKETT